MRLELRNYMKIAHPGMEISKPGYLKQRMKLNSLAFCSFIITIIRIFTQNPDSPRSRVI